MGTPIGMTRQCMTEHLYTEYRNWIENLFVFSSADSTQTEKSQALLIWSIKD